MEEYFRQRDREQTGKYSNQFLYLRVLLVSAVCLSQHYLLKAWATFQVIQLHDVVTVQDEGVGVLGACETVIQLLHTASWKVNHGSWGGVEGIKDEDRAVRKATHKYYFITLYENSRHKAFILKQKQRVWLTNVLRLKCLKAYLSLIVDAIPSRGQNKGSKKIPS